MASRIGRGRPGLKGGRRWALLAAAGGALALLLCAALYAQGLLLLVRPNEEKYPIAGIDVSEYQGEIDWGAAAGQGISFAFIKATEGSGYTDPCFRQNWQGARGAGLKVGAYHFFSFDSPGANQARAFLRTVPPGAGELPPVVDVELYGAHHRRPPPKERVLAELGAMLGELEARYQQKPMLYATMRAYRLYLAGDCDGYPLWIRNVVRAPRLEGGRPWLFWQYTGKGRLRGMEGRERFVDFNVFCGGAWEWQALLHQGLDGESGRPPL